MDPIIFCYHRVEETLWSDQNKLAISSDNFRSHLNYLKNKYQIVHADELIANPTKNTVAITFDDGYLDNFELVAPILVDMQIPATFYVTSRYVKQATLFYHSSLAAIYDARFANGYPRFLGDVVESLKPIELSFTELLASFKQIDYNSQWMHTVSLSEYCLDLGLNSALELPMNPGQVKELSRNTLFRVGAHTATHPQISRLTIEEISQEAKESIRFLEELEIDISRLFPIPFGQNYDFSDESIKTMRDDFDMFCMSTLPASYSKFYRSNYSAVPRLSVQDWDINYLKRVIKYMEVLSIAPQLTSIAMRGRRKIMNYFS